jgi:hypothetical protein
VAVAQNAVLTHCFAPVSGLTGLQDWPTGTYAWQVVP